MAEVRTRPAMGITRLGYCLDDDYPTINWGRHAPMADLWLKVDERGKAGQPVADLLGQIGYRLRFSRRWPRVDCVAMMPGLAVSLGAKAALEALGVPGLRFLEFRINDEPFFPFYTDRRVDCLDRERSELEFFRCSPGQVKEVVRYAFTEDRLCPCDLFTVPELSEGSFFWSHDTFLTEPARQTLEGVGLVGFRFEELPG